MALYDQKRLVLQIKGRLYDAVILVKVIFFNLKTLTLKSQHLSTIYIKSDSSYIHIATEFLHKWSKAL